jgi:hypothetical protein
MRKQPTERIVFSAEEIEIVQNDSEMNLFQEIYIPENKAGFNLLFLLSSDIYLEALGSHPKFLFRKNQYILYYSPEKKIQNYGQKVENLLNTYTFSSAFVIFHNF